MSEFKTGNNKGEPLLNETKVKPLSDADVLEMQTKAKSQINVGTRGIVIGVKV